MADVLPPEPQGLKEVQRDHRLSLEKLDNLLERYLNLLDQYQTARQQLANFFSSGYLSLAQANFNAPNHIHYGRDYYDERMQASRRVTIDPDSITTACTVSEYEPSVGDAGETSTDEGSPAERSSSAVTSTDEPTVVKPSDSAGRKVPPVDPLHWFGILVPPALRATQGQFVQAVEGPVPNLVNITREMRALESEISRLRKDIKRGALV